MAGDLTAPFVPGVSSIAEVIGRATQAAAIQSAQILSAARNIAADRQRAGEMAADAVVRMRLEDFQKEQFRQKKSIEDAQLGISLAANRRAELRAPLELGLLQAEIDQAPLRTALIGAQLTGANLGNTLGAAKLAEFPEDLRRDREREDLSVGKARLDYEMAQDEFDTLTSAEDNIKDISRLMTQTDLSNPDDVSRAVAELTEMSLQGTDSALWTNPKVAELYNTAADKLAPNEETKALLRIPEEAITAMRPETSMGLRVETEKRMLIEGEKRASLSKADSNIRIAKSKKEAFKGQTSKEAKNSIRVLDEAIQKAEADKISAENVYQKKLRLLNRGLELPEGEGDVETTLLDPKTKAVDYIRRATQ